MLGIEVLAHHEHEREGYSLLYSLTSRLEVYISEGRNVPQNIAALTRRKIACARKPSTFCAGSCGWPQSSSTLQIPYLFLSVCSTDHNAGVCHFARETECSAHLAFLLRDSLLCRVCSLHLCLSFHHHPDHRWFHRCALA